jgi:hypothetical protein
MIALFPPHNRKRPVRHLHQGRIEGGVQVSSLKHSLEWLKASWSSGSPRGFVGQGAFAPVRIAEPGKPSSPAPAGNGPRIASGITGCLPRAMGCLLLERLYGLKRKIADRRLKFTLLHTLEIGWRLSSNIHSNIQLCVSDIQRRRTGFRQFRSTHFCKIIVCAAG